jgi:hypothetical protein
MDTLSDCYFCGTVADDLEEYSVLPPEMDPPEERQRRVVVCPTCHEKLDRVIDPVVAFASEAGASGVEASGIEASEAGASGKHASETDSGAADDREPDETDGGSKAEATEAEPDDGSAGGGESGDPTDERSVGNDGEEEAEPGGESTGDEEAELGESDPPAVTELPPEANKVLRLLGNRSFPVDREEIVAVATNAYGLYRARAEAVLTALVDHGRLREENGTLYRVG